MKGSCFCENVSFLVQAPSLWCGHCHCTMCQKIHGSAFVTWVGCKSDDVVIEDENNSLKWYRSSSDAERGSCSHCGSNLFFRSANWPGELHIVRTAFIGDVDREPAGHSFFETHVKWFEFNDALPKKE